MRVTSAIDPERPVRWSVALAIIISVQLPALWWVAVGWLNYRSLFQAPKLALICAVGAISFIFGFFGPWKAWLAQRAGLQHKARFWLRGSLWSDLALLAASSPVIYTNVLHLLSD